MFSRILFSTIAAATLLAAAPALAAESAPKQPCSCCSDGSVHEIDHRVREEQARRAAERAAEARKADEDPSVRNQSWGG